MLAKVAEAYAQAEEKQQKRVRTLSPIQLLEFSVACDSQMDLDRQLITHGQLPEVAKLTMAQWCWAIRQQAPHMLLLSLTSQPRLVHAWVVTKQSHDMIELQTVERYARTVPRLYLQDHMKWFVSYCACQPPGLVLRRYRCSAVAKDLIEHASPWFIHSQSFDLVILHTIQWARQHKPLLGSHRMPMSFTAPNSPRRVAGS